MHLRFAPVMASLALALSDSESAPGVTVTAGAATVLSVFAKRPPLIT
jgi:hypothetical protein